MATRPAPMERRASVGFPTEQALKRVYAGAEDGVVQVRVARDPNGEVVDAEVVAWNRSFAMEIEPRLGRPLSVGTLLSEYARDLNLTLGYISEAMESGRSVQFLPSPAVSGADHAGCGTRRLLWHRFEDGLFGQTTDLTEYHRLQVQLADQKSLAAVAARARTLAEDRERIARNLHDTVIQRLYATSLEMEFLAMDGTPAPERRRIGEIARDLQQLIAEIRNEIFDVKHSIETGLREELLDVMLPMAQALGVSVEVETELHLLADPDLAQNVRAVVRESASNAIRHGHASRVTVRVAEVAGMLEVDVVDNGVGMADGAEETSGLINLGRRAELLGGSLEVSQCPEGGVRVRWSVPAHRMATSMHRMRGDRHDAPPSVPAARTTVTMPVTMPVTVDGVETDSNAGGSTTFRRVAGGGVSDTRAVVRRP